MTERSRLAVLIDGVALADEPARALWKEFSAHMDEHVGDFAGFAKLKGYVSVSPEHHKGQAVLVISTGKAPARGPGPRPAPGKGGAGPGRPGPARAGKRPRPGPPGKPSPGKPGKPSSGKPVKPGNGPPKPRKP